jgi:hypothetical protein
MIVTEQQAKQKLCLNGGGRCEGSFCMGWRWSDVAIRYRVRLCNDVLAEHEPDRPIDLPHDWKFCPTEDGEPSCWVEPEDEAQKRRTGYCGRAGAP